MATQAAFSFVGTDITPAMLSAIDDKEAFAPPYYART
jgi:hypothetical protein